MVIIPILVLTSHKLVLVLATSLSVIEASKEENMFSERVLSIYYLLRFQKDTVDVRALIDSGSKVNTITPAYALKLGLKVHSTNLKA